MKSPVHSWRSGPIARAAAAWVLDEQKGLSSRQRARRDAWLAADPLHAKAYHELLTALGELDRQAAHPEIMSLREASLAYSEDRPASKKLALWTAGVTAILILGVTGWSLFIRFNAPQPAAYATAVGERSIVPLADGSIVTLNTNSAVEVAYASGERAVRLLSGQAMFTVAHGQRAPFRVHAGDKIVTAIGTVFDVRIEADHVRVAVIEGAVRVTPRVQLASPVSVETLVAGEALVTSPEGAMSVKQVNVESVGSWRSGLLSFENTPLAEAIAEVNRYTQRQITLAEPRLGKYRMSGTFRAGEPERFARTLTQLFPVAVTASDTGIVIKPQ